MATTMPQAAAVTGVPVPGAPAGRVRLAHCGQCWQRPGRPCTITGTPGDHLARWQRAERRGLITRAELAAAVAALDVIAPHVIIRDGAP
jgi:hypothetical protein